MQKNVKNINKIIEYKAKVDNGIQLDVSIFQVVYNTSDVKFYPSVTNQYGETWGTERTLFDSAEEAQKYIQSLFDMCNVTAVAPNKVSTLASASCVSSTGIKHEVELKADVTVFKNGFIDVVYRVNESWGEMENGFICQGNYGSTSNEYGVFSKAYDDFNHIVNEYKSNNNTNNQFTNNMIQHCD